MATEDTEVISRVTRSSKDDTYVLNEAGIYPDRFQDCHWVIKRKPTKVCEPSTDRQNRGPSLILPPC